jgi:hypothetical protein
MKSRAIFLGLCVCLVWPAVAAEGAAPLTDRLPPGTLIYVGWGGRSLPFDGSMFGQLINDPLVSQAFGSLRAALDKQMSQEGQRELLAHAWEMGKVAWQRPAAAALIDLQPGEGGEPQPAAAVLLDLGKHRDAFAKHLDAVIAALGEEMPFTDATVGNVTYKVHRQRRGPTFAYGYVGTTLFVAVGEATPGLLVGLTPDKSLRTDPKFAECMKAVGGSEIQLAYYLNTSVLSARIEAMLLRAAAASEVNEAKQSLAHFKKALTALGLGKATAAAGTMRVVDRGMYTRSRVFTPAPHVGLLAPLAGPAITAADLAPVPADADVLAILKASPEKLYGQLRRALKTIEPRADRELAGGLAEIEKNLGISIEKDVLANLGDTWTLSSAPSQGGFLTGTVLTATVKDAAKLSAAIAKFEAFLKEQFGDEGEGGGPQPSLEVLKVGKAEIHYLALPLRHDPMPVAPAWAVHNGRFYLAAFPQVIQAVLAANGRKGLAQDPAYQQARKRIAGKPSALLYVNSPKIARQVYHWALIGWTLAANLLPNETGVPTKPGWLPPITSVEKYLWPHIMAVSSDPKGVTFEGYGSLPTPTLFGGLLLNQGPMWLLFPTVRSARAAAETTVEMSQVSQVLRAVMVYEVDKNRMPPELKGLLTGKYVAAASPLGRDVAAGKYAYLPPPEGKMPDRPGQTILVYLPRGPGRRFAIVGFADGHIERMGWVDFDRRLKAQLDGEDAAAPRN